MEVRGKPAGSGLGSSARHNRDMASDDEPLEVFTPTSGLMVAVLTWVGIAVALVAILLTSPTVVGLRWGVVLLLFALVVWVTQVRPRVLAFPDTLVIRHMLSDVHLPLASVDTVAARHVLYVWVGDERHSCAGIGRSTRALARGSGTARGSSEGAAGMDYVSYVETRIMDLAETARRERRQSASTRRVWAVPELVGFAVLLLLLVASLLVG